MSNQIVDIRENELPLTHTFSDGVYAREIFMPKGMMVIGQVHNTTHLNLVSKGSALVVDNAGRVSRVTAPFTFESKAGVRKVLFILEDMFWTTIHVTNETDIEVLENTLVDKSASEDVDIDSLLNNMAQTIKMIGE